MLKRTSVAICLLAIAGGVLVGTAGAAALAASQQQAIAELPRVDRLSTAADGTVTFVAGRLGGIDPSAVADQAPAAMRRLSVALGLGTDARFAVRDVEEDRIGQVHVRMQQLHNGLPVIGADTVLHLAARTGTVLAVNGTPRRLGELPTTPALDADKAIGLALEQVGIHGTALGEPQLTYVVGDDGRVHLAWSVQVAWQSVEGEERDLVFADAVDGTLAARHAQIHRSKYRRVYTANYGSSLPGTLLFNEGGSSSDTTAMGAYNNAGHTYDYYFNRFGRDSYNDAGATLTSTVHYGSSYNNAFWNGSQMVYGDGDGTNFSPFARAFDVVAHELTHAVTEDTANLVYQKEPGALNEAMSDIMASAAEAYVDGGITSTTWDIGEDCYTPGTSGDALRYMDNPTADGYSADYYPERLYPDPCTPNQNTNDLCGVHGNSGIANLAFVLLSQGGTHPRNKTSVNVPALGLSKAEQIFYRALTVYMTSSTDFEGARNATAQAATDLYGATDAAAVNAAWDAVGVPGGSGGGGGGTGELSNGVPVGNLSASQGEMDYWTMAVPSGASDLQFQISGGSGDADLYVRFGAQPTTSTYDCRPYLNGNNESCSFASPSAGTWYVMLRAYSSYSGVTLQGSYSTSAPNNPPTANFSFSTSDLSASFTDTSSDSDGSVVAWSWSFGDGASSSSRNPSHSYAAGGTYTVTLTVTDDDGATDSRSRSVTVTEPPGGGGAPCTSCTEYTGSLSGTGDADVQPDGTYYYAASGNHHGWLEGTGTDFDLYLYKWSGSRWNRVASSTSSSSSEEISYNGTSGYYYWRVSSYSGSGSYSLWLDTP